MDVDTYFHVRCISCGSILGAKQMPYEDIMEGGQVMRKRLYRLGIPSVANMFQDQYISINGLLAGAKAYALELTKIIRELDVEEGDVTSIVEAILGPTKHEDLRFLQALVGRPVTTFTTQELAALLNIPDDAKILSRPSASDIENEQRIRQSHITAVQRKETALHRQIAADIRGDPGAYRRVGKFLVDIGADPLVAAEVARPLLTGDVNARVPDPVATELTRIFIDTALEYAAANRPTPGQAMTIAGIDRMCCRANALNPIQVKYLNDDEALIAYTQALSLNRPKNYTEDSYKRLAQEDETVQDKRMRGDLTPAVAPSGRAATVRVTSPPNVISSLQRPSTTTSVAAAGSNQLLARRPTRPLGALPPDVSMTDVDDALSAIPPAVPMGIPPPVATTTTTTTSTAVASTAATGTREMSDMKRMLTADPQQSGQTGGWLRAR